MEGADSWATDAHKWLNTPYDCGIAVCADPVAHRRAMGVRAAYLPEGDAAGLREPIDYNPELSRRARSVPVWAALRQLGRRGVAELVERCCRMAELFAALLSEADGVEVLHQDLNQVVVRFHDPRGGDHDAHSRAVLGARPGRRHLLPQRDRVARRRRATPLGVQLAHRAGGRPAVGGGPAHRPPRGLGACQRSRPHACRLRPPKNPRPSASASTPMPSGIAVGRVHPNGSVFARHPHALGSLPVP